MTRTSLSFFVVVGVALSLSGFRFHAEPRKFFKPHESKIDLAGAPPLEKVPQPKEPEADPLLKKSWHLPFIGTFKAWRITQGHSKVSIAVIDSGVDYNHADINPNLAFNKADWPVNGIDDDGNGFIDDIIGWDFVKNFYLPWDRAGHGTAVSAIAAGAEGNGVGSAGVCPKCTIMPLRFIKADGTGWDEDGLAALRYAVEANAAVINISFAGEGYDRDYHEVLKEALAKDIVVVAAAGNDGENIDHSDIYPPRFKGLPNMIVVAATDRTNHLIKDPDSGDGSNWSKNYVHIAAPGEDIIAPWNDGTYDEMSGTSFSAPIVAGAAGLIRSANPKLSAVQIIKIMMATAHHVASLEDKVVSGGVLNLAAAMECATTGRLACLR